MAERIIMHAKDAVFGSEAECFMTIDGKRYNFMSMTEFESKWDPNIVKVDILGKVGKGHKAAGGNGTWSGKAHYNQSVFRKMADKYQLIPSLARALVLSLRMKFTPRLNVRSRISIISRRHLQGSPTHP